jgi:hypothetical protein
MAIASAAISHRSATLVHKAPLLGTQPPVPELTVPPRASTNVPGAHLYRASLRPEDVVHFAGVPVTSMARTLADLARHRPVGTAVAAIDWALHEQRVRLDEIQDVMLFCATWPLIARARRALDLADARAESPLESVSRLVLPRLGVPAPELQKSIFDADGRLVGRSDFYWDEVGVVGEADGRAKYVERRVLVREKERQEQFEDLGLVVVRWGWEQVTMRKHMLKARLEHAFARGRARDRAGFPRLWTL